MTTLTPLQALLLTTCALEMYTGNGTRLPWPDDTPKHPNGDIDVEAVCVEAREVLAREALAFGEETTSDKITISVEIEVKERHADPLAHLRHVTIKAKSKIEWAMSDLVHQPGSPIESVNVRDPFYGNTEISRP